MLADPAPVADVCTIQDVARDLKCTPATVRALIHRGELVAYRVGRHFRVDPDAVRAFKTRATVVPATPARVAPIRPRTPHGSPLERLPAAQLFRR